MSEPQTGEAYAAVMCELYRILGKSQIIETPKKDGPMPDKTAQAASKAAAQEDLIPLVGHLPH